SRRGWNASSRSRRGSRPNACNIPRRMTAFPETFNLADYFLFDRLNEGFSDTVALRFGARSWTYGDVAEKSRRFAGLLLEAGVARGERVLIVLPDVPPFA